MSPTGTAFSWNDYLKLARGMKSNPQESVSRTIATRAYYAAYHQAQSRLASVLNRLPTPGAGAGMHRTFWDYVSAVANHNPDLAAWTLLANTGSELYGLRLHADYKLAQFERTLSEDALVKAQQIVDLLPKLTRAHVPPGW